MAVKSKKVLGKGLGALIPKKKKLKTQIKENSSHKKIQEIELKEIIPDKSQPRVIFEQDKLDELCHSIKNHGVIQPILLRIQNNGKYKIIFGERRYRASKMLGKKTIPAMLTEANDAKSHMIALIENIQRENLNAIEEGEAYKKLLDEGHFTQEQLAEKLGKSRSAIANAMRLLKLPSKVKNFLIEKKLSMGHVRCLLSLENEEEQFNLAFKAIEKGLSVRELENEVSVLISLKNTVPDKPDIKKDKKIKEIDPDLNLFVEKLQHRFSCKVLLSGNHDKGRLHFEYHTKDDLHRIFELLGALEE